jgi:hypothetical protein
MKTLVFTSVFAALFVTELAHAEEDRPSEKPTLVAPKNALELNLGQGFTQGFGEPASQSDGLAELSRGGMSLQLGIGYRLNPHWMIGSYAEGSRYFAKSNAPDGTVAYGAAFGMQTQWHALPFSQIDPWIGLGGGWRGYWLDVGNAGHQSLYGFDIVRLRIGADYKLGPSTSVGPMLGATMTLFDSVRTLEAESAESTKNPQVSTFVFAGFQGRFEIGGERVAPTGRTVASR